MIVIRPFKIAISEDDLEDLKLRLSLAKLPKSHAPESWEDGASLAFTRAVIDHWRTGFDWRKQETRLNQLPHFTADIDGLQIHFIHKKGVGTAPMPLVLTHGWPGSFAEFEEIIPLLTDPQAHGGDADDAFSVVVPSLPGYGFSSAPQTNGVGSRAIARMWNQLMTLLGYDRYGAQGGDIGSGVSIWLARQFPHNVIGAHLNYVSAGLQPSLTQHEKMSAEETSFRQTAASWAAAEGAYSALHSTKPQTLAFSLSDSPAGLAAWIIEKFQAWSDCGGDLESILSLDTILTDVSLHWFSNNLNASLRLYKENRLDPLTFAPGERIKPPVGMAHFPLELPVPPRSWVERVATVTRWSEMPAGGHFAALEQPQRLAEEIRAFFRPLR